MSNISPDSVISRLLQTLNARQNNHVLYHECDYECVNIMSKKINGKHENHHFSILYSDFVEKDFNEILEHCIEEYNITKDWWD